jgi:hypothetical protein
VLTPAEAATEIITSSIGDYDCFGYGAPNRIGDIHSPGGALASYPLHEPDDAANTDLLLACPGPAAITFTHTYDLPLGSRILGAVWTKHSGNRADRHRLDRRADRAAAHLDPRERPPDHADRARDAERSFCDDVFVDTMNLAIAVRR